MTRALIVVHRWLGVAFCLLFAMWFATGIVMHFVPFPALTETERVNGLAPIDVTRVKYGPAEAVAASKLTNVTRVRLWERTDGPAYVVAGSSGAVALRANDLAHANMQSVQLVLAIGRDHARRRGLDVRNAALAGVAHYDQWTVPNGFDAHRPLFRVAINDNAGTELYVSSVTGEIVLDTTGRERWWNYVGSVSHWIYPTALRKNWAAWDKIVWAVSIVAVIAVISGAVLGMIRIRLKNHRLTSPYRGWHAWHHVLGLISLTFVLTWILSGWLSMDHGRLFSTGKVTQAEAAAIIGMPTWETLSWQASENVSLHAREIEWFALGGRNYRRERLDVEHQRLSVVDTGAAESRAFLRPDEINTAVAHVSPGCYLAGSVAQDDNYAIASTMPHAPVYRTVCGDVWFQIDGASGAILEKLDSSRRAYRWFYSALHTFDVPFLVAWPTLRSVLIVVLCGCGLGFSLTGIVIGWRRARLLYHRRKC
jgi:PepSY-associated TM region